MSTASSLYSTQEEKQAAEIRKLRKELVEAQTKVNTLSGQLSTNVSKLFFPYIKVYLGNTGGETDPRT